MQEGARTWGLWLPLALADIRAAILAPWIPKEKAGEALDLARTLAGWCLPVLSRAVKEQQAENEALALFNSIKNLAAKQEAKRQ